MEVEKCRHISTHMYMHTYTHAYKNACTHPRTNTHTNLLALSQGMNQTLQNVTSIPEKME